MLLADPVLDDPLERLGFTRRDRAILALARKHVGDSRDRGLELVRVSRGRVEALGAWTHR